jgi:hypothetical protein
LIVMARATARQKSPPVMAMSSSALAAIDRRATFHALERRPEVVGETRMAIAAHSVQLFRTAPAKPFQASRSVIDRSDSHAPGA